jgi:Lon protease-like protein
MFKKVFNSFFSKKEDPDLFEIAVFPLPNVVLFPEMSLPLHIFENRYKDMIQDALDQENPIAVSFLDRENNLKKICSAGLLELLNLYPDGRMDVLVKADQKLEIVKITQKKPYLKAKVRRLKDTSYQSALKEEESLKELELLAKRWVFLSPSIEDDNIELVNIFTRAHLLADFIGFYFFEEAHAKQELLEITDRSMRVEYVKNFVKDQISTIEKKGFSLLESDDESHVFH